MDGWAQIDLSHNLLPLAGQCCRRLGLQPALVQDELGAQLVFALERNDRDPEPQLLTELLAHEVMQASSQPVHFALGRNRPPDRPEWLDIRGHQPRRANPEPVDPQQAWAAYQASSLAAFHQHYFQQAPHPVERWAISYESIDPEQLPDCLSPFLRPDHPGWRQDQGLTHFTRGLLALGWHPRHIAGVMASRFRLAGARTEEAWREADFVARCGAGLIHQKLDGLNDFDCGSVRDHGWCPTNPDCRVSLLEMQAHLRTGSWEP
ncbi:MAG: hypothetical protein U0931_24475 [Vulcanimicrobiota bacterium]